MAYRSLYAIGMPAGHRERDLQPVVIRDRDAGVAPGEGPREDLFRIGETVPRAGGVQVQVDPDHRVAFRRLRGRLTQHRQNPRGFALQRFHRAFVRDHVIGARVPTRRPVRFLNVGDFDGDLIQDLAIVESGAAGSAKDTLSIAFGARDGESAWRVPAERALAEVAR